MLVYDVILSYLHAALISVFVMCVTWCIYRAAKPEGLFAAYGEWMSVKHDKFLLSDKKSFWLSPFFWCPICTNFWVEAIVVFSLYWRYHFSAEQVIIILFFGTFLIDFVLAIHKKYDV